jgi:hypothetical protein
MSYTTEDNSNTLQNTLTSERQVLPAGNQVIYDHWMCRHNGNCVTTNINVYMQCHRVTVTKHTSHSTHAHTHNQRTLELHNLHAERRAGNWLKLRCWTNDSRQRACEVEKWHFTGSSSKRIIKTEDRLYKYYYYLLLLSCHSVAVVLTPVQTKQIRINMHKRNNTKTQYKQYKKQ